MPHERVASQQVSLAEFLANTFLLLDDNAGREIWRLVREFAAPTTLAELRYVGGLKQGECDIQDRLVCDVRSFGWDFRASDLIETCWYRYLQIFQLVVSSRRQRYESYECVPNVHNWVLDLISDLSHVLQSTGSYLIHDQTS